MAATPRTRRKENAVTVHMHTAKPTTRTIQFKEIDAEGEFLDQHAAQIGTLYVPKKTLAEMGNPDTITVSVSA